MIRKVFHHYGGSVKICSECQREFPDNQKFCPQDGTALKPKPAPSTKSERLIALKQYFADYVAETGVRLSSEFDEDVMHAIEVLEEKYAHCR